MTNQDIHLNEKVWIEKVLAIYWIMVFIAICGQVIGVAVTALYTPERLVSFIGEKLIIPTVLQAVLLLFAGYLIKKKNIYNVRLLTLIGVLATAVTVWTHASVTGLQVLFVVILSVNLVYFNKSYLRFSLIISMITLGVLYFDPDVRLAASEYERFTYFFVLYVVYRVFLLVIDRGSEILTSLKRSNEQEKILMVKSAMMERLTKVDPLTELYNHKTFQEYLDFLHEQGIYYDMPLQLAIIDIDNFKYINDNYGHSTGDLILKRIATIIEQEVTENEIVARYGGEEFAILLTNKSHEESQTLIEHIRQSIEQFFHPEIDGNVTVSIGLQRLHADMTKETFFNRADQLLYHAKRTGKNKVSFEKNTKNKN
ncbi:diguanylate cyclase (GGDEF) domain-containing protein [Pelagirhabdus alkalitolerans]|uniref:Diguanylate cyclase (GGDEF) domain-containing protein n=1 Tax=Pelagirhabdus alkalitolerans TaxID=1612202 RepID=A0A1G6H5R7_9BACI|nr:GGDEF domain-containing protein [Pelagirhabdus alkalitolerans]SDB89627.1 diguanylate cyclase (GGDEF) domain-containing protein [Pelagirhabdus alkalitolerans]